MISHDLRGALPPAPESHFAAVTEPDQIAGILRALDENKGTFQIRECALRLAPLVFVRPGELRKADNSSEFDLDAAEWTLKLSKRKKSQQADPTKDEYLIVPLPRQAMQILRDLHALTGGGTYAFRGCRDKERPLSDNAVLAALRRVKGGVKGRPLGRSKREPVEDREAGYFGGGGAPERSGGGPPPPRRVWRGRVGLVRLALRRLCLRR